MLCAGVIGTAESGNLPERKQQSNRPAVVAQHASICPRLLPLHSWLTTMEELSSVAGQATETAGQPPAELNTTITRTHRSVAGGDSGCWAGRLRWPAVASEGWLA